MVFVIKLLIGCLSSDKQTRRLQWHHLSLEGALWLSGWISSQVFSEMNCGLYREEQAHAGPHSLPGLPGLLSLGTGATEGE